jgi:hypothetical protein
MIPSVNDRLASVIRALTDVIMPSLPPEAGLAQEQIQLAIGHLQILQAQMDGTPAFEVDEADDAKALGEALLAAGEGGNQTSAALADLKSAVEAVSSPRELRVAIHTAIDGLVKATAGDGSSGFKSALGQIIIKHQTPRTMKDRKWFELMGFDAGI